MQGPPSGEPCVQRSLTAGECQAGQYGLSASPVAPELPRQVPYIVDVTMAVGGPVWRKGLSGVLDSERIR